METPLGPHPIILNYDGIFDLEALYHECTQFFAEKGFKFEEPTYKVKATEEEITWKPERKVTDYVKYTMAINFWILDKKDVDVIKEGKKVKLTKAHVRILLGCEVIKDYSGRFKGKPYLKKIKNFYEKFVFKKEFDTIWDDELYYNLYDLHTLLKKHLDSDTKANAFYDVW